jgi:hypothetical protein
VPWRKSKYKKYIIDFAEVCHRRGGKKAVKNKITYEILNARLTS